MPSSGVQTCALDRKSTRLNSSHGSISYAVFCLKKKTCPQPPLPGFVPLCPLSASPFHIALHSRRLALVFLGRRPSGTPCPPQPFLCFFLMNRRPPKSTLFPISAPFR